MGFFSKRKINKQAVSQPKDIMDFYSMPFSVKGIDGTAFACMDRIASEFAGLNYGVFDAKTRQKVKKNSLYAVLKQPNLEERHYNFFYQSALDYFKKGCFWRVIRLEGQVVSLFRLNPDMVTVKRSDTGKRYYVYRGNIYYDEDIVYIPSRFDFSTLTGGSSIFDAASSTFNTSKSLETFTQKSFTNGIVGKRLVIDISGAYPNVTPEQSAEIKQSFQNEYSGVENAGRPLLKKKGIEYSELGGNASTDNQAAQLSENRKLQEHEIAKIFGVPVELLNGLDSKGNLENIFVLFNEFALRPLATMFQEAINNLLDEDRFYFEFDYNGVMKVSLQTRIDAYIKQINNGLLSPNEAREKENLSPLPEAGDNFFMPVNLMPLNDETVSAYMAKQKNEINGNNPTDATAQHFGGGDDKQ